MGQVIFIQGAYFLATGMWPLLHMASFIIVTGGKTDLWLVRTVGLLVSVTGAALIAAVFSSSISLPVLVISVGSAASLFLVDIIYVCLRVIRPIYLLDALAEGAFIVAIVSRQFPSS